ncbi:hypothetical protein JZ751_016060 [Albula glossodonta]|uniref:Uncharacterized protein n=1 Tax=Albula glossodonta TaxID=121402 RepID=A0A8T2NP45_9TELE|nr:hypothetical protein JZ751_016060 [Albula glossodonta]
MESPVSGHEAVTFVSVTGVSVTTGPQSRKTRTLKEWQTEESFGIPVHVAERRENLRTEVWKTNDISLYGTPVFPLNLDNFEESEQRLLTFEILHVYDRILSDMQNCTQERDVKMSIMSVRHQMKDARTHYFQRREEALKKRLHEIWAVNTTDLTVQRKAVRELLPVFLAASRLGNRAVEKEERRRRRRHATRSRIPRP